MSCCRRSSTARIDVAPGTLETGIQLQAPSLNDEVASPGGQYTFQLWGWTDHKRGEPANLRTEFEVELSEPAAGQVKWFLETDDATWVGLRASDGAVGIQTVIGKVRAGLPAA